MAVGYDIGIDRRSSAHVLSSPYPGIDHPHRCFNQLDLPNYSTKESMRQKLITAITEGSEGFALA